MGSSSMDKSRDRVSAGRPELVVVVRKLTSSRLVGGDSIPAATSGSNWTSEGDGNRGSALRAVLRDVLPRGVKEIRGSGVCLKELGVS